MWWQKTPPKHGNGGRKRRQNIKVGAKSAPTQIRAEKVWWQKVPSKCKSGGRKRRQNSKVPSKSAPTQIRGKKSWWRKVPSKWKSDGRKCHHISNCGGILTTTYHIQGAGAPAKTKIGKCLWHLYFFGKRSDLFRILQNL